MTPLDVLIVRERVFSLLPNTTLSKVSACSRAFRYHVRNYHHLRENTKIRFRITVTDSKSNPGSPITLDMELKCTGHLFLEQTPLVVFDNVSNFPLQDLEDSGPYQVICIAYASNRGASGQMDLSVAKCKDLYIGGISGKECWLYGSGFKLEMSCQSAGTQNGNRMIRTHITRAYLDCSFVYGCSTTNSCSSTVEKISQDLTNQLDCYDRLFPCVPSSRSLNMCSRRIRSPPLPSSSGLRYVPIARAESNNFGAQTFDFMLAKSADDARIIEVASTDLAKSLAFYNETSIRKIDVAVAKSFANQQKAEELLAGMTLSQSKRDSTEYRMKHRVVKEVLSKPLASAFLKCSSFSGDINDASTIYGHLSELYKRASLNGPSPHQQRPGDLVIVPIAKFQDWIFHGLMNMV
ncbi:hypothetical protein SmJEL517_g05394 [Synchytrium microbalum]|uniref:Uncharacterized protein n=1 Tax=Synchytrium microbalum TaxID=1806994 RepID=A0A507BLR2_9FUNG|nr:uncharacterized protein SmJEL517_g05394 [Synchytrium microbalum]TPX31270.1 hypothetical protein SmJEL517_g05394 [Synchytrium microbalum]